MKHQQTLLLVLFSLLITAMLPSCEQQGAAETASHSKEALTEMTAQMAAENAAAMRARMKEHLDAVSNRDAETLASTMSPSGKMQLILPATEIKHGVEAFMDYHREWFKDTIWTFETKILSTQVGETMGLAITEVIYREPERDGKPYFNRMTVSYDLAKENDVWYIVKDHASSIEKSNDKK